MYLSAFRLIATRVRNKTDLFTLFWSSLLLLFSYYMLLFRWHCAAPPSRRHAVQIDSKIQFIFIFMFIIIYCILLNERLHDYSSDDILPDILKRVRTIFFFLLISIRHQFIYTPVTEIIVPKRSK